MRRSPPPPAAQLGDDLGFQLAQFTPGLGDNAHFVGIPVAGGAPSRRAVAVRDGARTKEPAQFGGADRHPQLGANRRCATERLQVRLPRRCDALDRAAGAKIALDQPGDQALFGLGFLPPTLGFRRRFIGRGLRAAARRRPRR